MITESQWNSEFCNSSKPPTFITWWQSQSEKYFIGKSFKFLEKTADKLHDNLDYEMWIICKSLEKFIQAWKIQRSGYWSFLSELINLTMVMVHQSTSTNSFLQRIFIVIPQQMVKIIKVISFLCCLLIKLMALYDKIYSICTCIPVCHV